MATVQILNSELSFKLFADRLYLATIQLSTGSAMLASDLNSNSERLRMRLKCPTRLHCELPSECLVFSTTSAFSNGNYLWLPLKL